jgi:hypothetical protein
LTVALPLTPVGRLPLWEMLVALDAVKILVKIAVLWVTVWLAVPLASVIFGMGFTVIVAGDDTAPTQPLEFLSCTVYVVFVVKA